MSAAPTWSARATPLASVAGSVMFTLGVFCIVLAAVSLSMGDRAWNLPAYACLLLAAWLVVLRVRSMCRVAAHELSWDPASGCFHVAGGYGAALLTQVWHGPGWVTLGLRSQAAPNRVLRVVLWKSTVPPPLWSELALRILANPLQDRRHQNKENP